MRYFHTITPFSTALGYSPIFVLLKGTLWLYAQHILGRDSFFIKLQMTIKVSRVRGVVIVKTLFGTFWSIKFGSTLCTTTPCGLIVSDDKRNGNNQIVFNKSKIYNSKKESSNSLQMRILNLSTEPPDLHSASTNSLPSSVPPLPLVLDPFIVILPAHVRQKRWMEWKVKVRPTCKSRRRGSMGRWRWAVFPSPAWLLLSWLSPWTSPLASQRREAWKESPTHLQAEPKYPQNQDTPLFPRNR